MIVGDLFDRGPDSSGVLALVRERLAADPRRWIQFIGNYEAQYLGIEPFWPERLDDSDADLLRRSWTCAERIRVRSAVDRETRHTTTRIGGTRFIAVDPKHGRTGAPRWSPLVLDGVVLD